MSIWHGPAPQQIGERAMGGEFLRRRRCNAALPLALEQAQLPRRHHHDSMQHRQLALDRLRATLKMVLPVDGKLLGAKLGDQRNCGLTGATGASITCEFCADFLLDHVQDFVHHDDLDHHLRSFPSLPRLQASCQQSLCAGRAFALGEEQCHRLPPSVTKLPTA